MGLLGRDVCGLCATVHGWANLHGPPIHSANTRVAVPVFRSLCHRLFDRVTPSDTSVCFVIEVLHKDYEVLYIEPLFVSDAGRAATRSVHPTGHLVPKTSRYRSRRKQA